MFCAAIIYFQSLCFCWITALKSVLLERGGRGLEVRTVTILCIILHHDSTLSKKNRAHNIMPHNSHKFGPILIILSQSHSRMNCRKVCVGLPPHLKSVASLPCEIQLCSFEARYSMQMWCRIVYLQYLSTRDANFCFLLLCRLICNSTICTKLSARSTHACFEAISGCISDALLNAAVQNV